MTSSVPVSPPFTPGVSCRILVVDDDPDVRSVEAVILQRDGHRVETVEDGEAAWHALVGGGYDLLVTDYIMPGLSGLALVRQLRVADMALPVVMVSGNLDGLDAARLSADPWSRVDAFLAKPFTVPELLSAVNRVLGRKTAGAGSDRRKMG